MSVAFVLSRGVVVVDLFLGSAPMNSFNFLKLCKIGWFDNALFVEILENRLVRVGQIDCPKGETIYSLISGNKDLTVPDEINSRLSHSVAGLLSTCNDGPHLNNSNFFITLGGDMSRHDSKRTIFGEVGEGFELIKKIAMEPVDAKGRPLRNIRILRTHILHDPFDDPPGFASLVARFSPFGKRQEIDRLEDGEEFLESEQQEEAAAQRKAEQNANILEMLGDIPDAYARPSETTLFVCNLNSITEADGLKIFFSRFGEVESVDLIKNRKTGESRGYAFVKFNKTSQAENAFLKAQRAVIDGRIIKVDFCQSLKHGKQSFTK